MRRWIGFCGHRIGRPGLGLAIVASRPGVSAVPVVRFYEHRWVVNTAAACGKKATHRVPPRQTSHSYPPRLPRV